MPQPLARGGPLATPQRWGAPLGEGLLATPNQCVDGREPPLPSDRVARRQPPYSGTRLQVKLNHPMALAGHEPHIPNHPIGWLASHPYL
jgi:hypothetical protein